MTQQAVLGESTSFVLDASALLAWLHREPGLEIVEASLGSSVICSVNWSEVLQKIIARGDQQPQDVGGDLEFLGLIVIPFTAGDAMTAANLWAVGRNVGLSLGDRACLSLAQRLGLPALTTDRVWETLSLGIDVRLIR